MANKRMFDKSVVDTEAFYALPLESQLLYFHLGLHADVRGFVEPRKIARLTGIKIDALRPLIESQFVILFESGVVVITHWNQNNTLRAEREAPSRFDREASQITLQDNGIYVLQEYSGVIQDYSRTG